MHSKCDRCGGELTDDLHRCDAADAVRSDEVKRPRKRLGIPFAVVLAIGFVGALVAGGRNAGWGKPALASTVPPRQNIGEDPKAGRAGANLLDPQLQKMLGVNSQKTLSPSGK